MNKDQIRETLISDEGWVPHAYQDHLGYWTIGYGFLVDKERGGEIPKEVADFWLDCLIEEKWHALRNELPWLDSQPEPVQQALTNMAYQLGVRGVLQFRKMLAELRAGNRLAAAEQALDSRWGKQTPNRARRVARMIRGQ